MKALIDADILVYRVGYTTNDVNEAIACARMNESMKGILDALECTEYKAFLTGQEKDNFRYTIYPEYKAGRTQEKPIHYQTLRDHLIVGFGALVVNGMEADDALGITQCEAEPDSTIIVSIDKDLNQIPGWHYNFVKGLKYKVDPLEGTRYFYEQILQGDRVDNISGLVGVGPKTATKWLKDCKTEKEMFDVVLHKYREIYGEAGESMVVRNGSLLKIRTSMEEGIWIRPLGDRSERKRVDDAQSFL